MRLIVNCRFLTQELTGVQRFAEEITKRLPNLVGDIEFVAPTGALRHRELGGVPVRQIGRLRGHAWEQFDLARYVHHHDYTLLSLANTGPVSVRKQLLVIHDLTWMSYPQSYSWKFRMAYRILTTLLVRKAHSLVTVSNFSRHDIAQHFNLDEQTIGVIGNAVDDRFRTSIGRRPAGAPDEEFLLVVSSLNKHKNVGPFVGAYRRYRKQSQTQVPLVLVGGSGRAFTSSVGINASVQDGVIALGRVSDEELIWLYHHAKAFFFPSLYEGFGIPPLEAIACGCPVYSSNAASMPEVLGDRVAYFDPTSADEMGAAICLAISSREPQGGAPKESTLTENCEGWDQKADQLLSLLSKELSDS